MSDYLSHLARLTHLRLLVSPTDREALRAELEALRAERDALREGAKRVADLLEESGCDCDCECDSDGHDDCDPCLACRIDAAIRRAHMWTHVDDLPVCSRCGVVRRAGGETVCRGRTPTIATREGLEVSAGGYLEVSAGGSVAEASEAPADTSSEAPALTSSEAPAKEGLESAAEVPSALAALAEHERREGLELRAALELLRRLRDHGGAIVASSSLSSAEIAAAWASDRMRVDDRGYGYVWMPSAKRGAR